MANGTKFALRAPTGRDISRDG